MPLRHGHQAPDTMDFSVTAGHATRWLLAALTILATVPSHVARADDEEPKRDDGIPTPSIATSLPQNGDPTGARAALAKRGITYGLNYTGEVLGNTSGGLKRSATYFGLLDVNTTIDFEKLAGWKGLTFFANAYQIHGHGLSTNNLGPNLHTVSDIEATPDTRLDEMWFEQKWLDDKVALRFGTLAADTEFFVSDVAFPTVNATFGWPSSFAAALPAGGAAYPLTAVGARLKLQYNDALTSLFGVYNGDPVGARCAKDDPQRCNDNGLDFRLGDSTFAIVELQWKHGQEKGGMPGIIKVGGWKHFGSFADQRTDTTGLSLADPASSGTGRRADGNYSLYAIADQRVFNGKSGEKIDLFGRYTFVPSDRNLISNYFDAGASFTGFVPKRADDSVIVAFAYSPISSGARGFDRDAVAFGSQTIVRDYEALLEVTYIAKVLPGLTLQPDFQYIWHPGGNIDDGTGKPIADAAVFGLRSVVNY
jgi:porin